jgi:ATP-binding cassette subfamily B protein
MARFLKPVWKTALMASMVVILRVAVEVLAVYFLSPAVTAVATKLPGAHSSVGFIDWITGASESARALREILLWMASTQLALGFMIYLRAVWDTKLSMRAVFFMRAAVYDRLQKADLTYHDTMSTGALINRAINDLQAVRQFVNMSLLSSLDIVVSLAFYLGLLFMRSPSLMAAALVPVPFWCWVIFRYSKSAQPLCRESQEASDRAMGALAENLAGVQVVRAFATEDIEVKKYQAFNDSLLGSALKTVRLQAMLTPALKLIGTASHVVLFVIAALLIRRGDMQVGDLMLLGATMAVILSKLQGINQVVEAYQKAIVSSRRLFEIMDLPDAASSGATARPLLSIHRGDIEFRDVSFSYARKAALDHVSITIPGGKVTALVGPTASGKSTLAGLLARFYDPDQGEILIDGQDLREVDRRDLRRRIGYVFQETFLFSSTIRDNILYGRRDVSEEMLQRAAKIAHADEFIEKLPNGYDTLIGERGVNLSGGQKQRLALARALVYDPEILVLDDATAALDASTERVIHTRLDPVFRGRTVLVIANRLASVHQADHVIVMENGRITQSGTHQALAASEGHYRDIVMLQELA